MTPDEIREYNKIVIEVSEKMIKPWKWMTFILSVLLAGFMAFHFLCPAEVEIGQENNQSQNSVNYKG